MGEEGTPGGSNGQNSQDNQDFDMSQWAIERLITRKTLGTLREEEFTTKEALCLLTESDIRSLPLSLGQKRLLEAAIQALKVEAATGATTAEDTPEPPTDGGHAQEDTEDRDATTVNIGDIRAQASTLRQAGEAFDSLFQSTALPRPTAQSIDTVLPTATARTEAISRPSDPRAMLTIKARSKHVLHITQFLPESAKARRRTRYKDALVVSGGSGDSAGQLLVRADDSHPYRGITHDEWGAANMRLLNHLLATGELARSQIEFYLAYTATIHEFYQRYEWAASILDFDFVYREQQAAMGFVWGDISPLSQLRILIPRHATAPSHAGSSVPPRQAGARDTAGNQTQDCRLWLASNGSCRFGRDCRYRHPPLPQRHHETPRAELPKNGPPQQRPPPSAATHYPW